MRLESKACYFLLVSAIRGKVQVVLSGAALNVRVIRYLRGGRP